MKFKYLFENNIDLLEAFELPIADGSLGREQSRKIKTIILRYLARFNKEVPSSRKVVVDENNADEKYIKEINLKILDLYNNMSFAVCTNRAENRVLVSKKGIVLQPDEMSKTVVSLISGKLSRCTPMISCAIEGNTVAYVFKLWIPDIQWYFPDYHKKSEEIYVKFDFRKNTSEWYEPDEDKRDTVKSDPKQKRIKISDDAEKNNKLTLISFHSANM